MKTNKVAPWEGRLVWVGTPRTGKSRNDNDWKQVDFTLEYNDEEKVKHITFSLFGIEKVDKLLAVRNGTLLRVRWVPESREFNGKWWPSFAAYETEVVEGGNSARPSEKADDDDLPY